MAKKLEVWGALVTVIYLVVIGVTVIDKFEGFRALKLNELGDFLAGAFGPIAFLWLVLGFLQQGRELRISSAALQAQADELKHSVEQHKDMVILTRSQLDLERENRTASDNQRRKAISPFFVATHAVTPVADSFNVFLSITNKGERVTKVSVDFSDRLSHFKMVYADFESLFTANFNIPCNPGEQRYAGTLSISYFDIDQSEGVKIFDLVMVPPSGRNVSPSVIITPRD